MLDSQCGRGCCQCRRAGRGRGRIRRRGRRRSQSLGSCRRGHTGNTSALREFRPPLWSGGASGSRTWLRRWRGRWCCRRHAQRGTEQQKRNAFTHGRSPRGTRMEDAACAGLKRRAAAVERASWQLQRSARSRARLRGGAATTESGTAGGGGRESARSRARLQGGRATGRARLRRRCRREFGGFFAGLRFWVGELAGRVAGLVDLVLQGVAGPARRCCERSGGAAGGVAVASCHGDWGSANVGHQYGDDCFGGRPVGRRGQGQNH
jgi:hypothetical protein